MGILKQSEYHKKLLQQCVHFNGMHQEVCKAGVDYKTVTDRSENPRSGLGIRLACFPGDEASMQCPKLEPWKLEDALAEEKRRDAAIEAHLAKLQGDICPDCNRKVENKVQVGPCVYAEPCGHRLYQGKLPKNKKS